MPSAKLVIFVAVTTLAVACASADASAARTGTDHRAYVTPAYGYGPDNYPGYSPGYAYGQASPSVYGYGGYGLAPEDYLETCTYAGGPKAGNWNCR